jgi:peptidoglycan/xylan/chitin deacetylase (PgdA/CDA1 family)
VPVYFFKTPRLFEIIYPDAVWHAERDKKQIYLTFDDGPVPVVTDYVLDLLAQFEVKATFFCVGENVKKHPDIFKRLIREGHGIGNHTYNHLNGWRVDEDIYLKNIQACTDIFQLAGYESNHMFFRPPYGKIRRKTIKKLQGNYKIIMWDVLPYDFSDKVDADRCLSKSIKYTKNGSIIIFHDNLRTFETLKLIISQFIATMKEKNYEFCKIDSIFS